MNSFTALIKFTQYTLYLKLEGGSFLDLHSFTIQYCKATQKALFQHDYLVHVFSSVALQL